MIISRRDLLLMAGASALPIKLSLENPNEETAKKAIAWIRSQGTATGAGRAWPAIPGKPESMSPDLYSGTAGVTLLLAEAGRLWKDESMLEEARQGAKDMQSWAPQMYESGYLGLYTGLAGIIWVISRLQACGISDPTWQSDPNLDLASIYAFDLAKRKSAMETNDVISGLAGIGLAMLEKPLVRETKDWVEAASGIGDDLVARAHKEPTGNRWALSEGFERDLPNFSHGTAGVAFFLAKLYGRTRKKSHLEAAVKGAEYLQAIAHKEGEGCLIYHSDPDGLDRYYLGWCHGPAGTSQLWWQLAKATGDKKWAEWAQRGAKSLLDVGVPETRTTGYWNNEGLCCGTAGIGRFLLAMYRRTGGDKYLAAAQRCATELVRKAEPSGSGLSWTFAENRVAPQTTAAQTGWMQGAAGIAAFLLDISNQRRPFVKLLVDAD